MLNALILAALSVVPVYTNHNRVAGNVQTMTNIQSWAQAVEEAIGSGGMDTNAVSSIITNHVETGYLCANKRTNDVGRAFKLEDKANAKTIIESNYGGSSGILPVTRYWYFHGISDYASSIGDETTSVKPVSGLGQVDFTYKYFAFEPPVTSTLTIDGTPVATSNMVESVAVAAASAMTNGLMRASDYHGDYISDGESTIKANRDVIEHSRYVITNGVKVLLYKHEPPSFGKIAEYRSADYDGVTKGVVYYNDDFGGGICSPVLTPEYWPPSGACYTCFTGQTINIGDITVTVSADMYAEQPYRTVGKLATDAAIIAATNDIHIVRDDDPDKEWNIHVHYATESVGATWSFTSDTANKDSNGNNIVETYARKDGSLKNPNALTFTGAASGTYDGSVAKTVNIPSTDAIESSVASVSNRQDTLEGYIAGQRVRVSVTNYYGNTSGQLPRLRIEEFITATNVTDGVSTETNYWKMVWDEQDKYDQFKAEATSAIAAMTNNLYQTYYALLMERLNTKAPRAWGTLTSAGEAAPAGSVWHTEPNTVFAGGTEYAHAMVGTGVIGVLTTKGAAVYTDGETGRFHFTTDDKTSFFGMNIATRYELGCATDGITVTDVGGNKMVDLLYNVTMTGKPILYYTPTLSGNITWEQITDSSGGAISGATVYASWDAAPPAGSEICTINCGAGVSGFFKASVEYAGTCKFETNMMADLQGGVLATNQTSNQMQPVEPYISNGSVLWRIKQ